MICWLASYPKSGNTWLRALLSNWLADGESPLHPNEFIRVGMSIQDTAQLFWKRYPEIPLDKQHKIRPMVMDDINEYGQGKITFVKTHTGNFRIQGYPLLPPEITRNIVYLVRDPRGVAPSWARHAGESIEKTLDNMSNPQWCLIHRGIAQHMGTWTMHVESFLSEAYVIKYEDMVADTRAVFGGLLDHLGLPIDERADKAVEFSTLETLKALEEKEPVEQSKNGRFFGATTQKLTRDQCARVEGDHGQVMSRLGYL